MNNTRLAILAVAVVMATGLFMAGVNTHHRIAAQRKELPLPCPPVCVASQHKEKPKHPPKLELAKLDRAWLDRGTLGRPMD